MRLLAAGHTPWYLRVDRHAQHLQLMVDRAFRHPIGQPLRLIAHNVCNVSLTR